MSEPMVSDSLTVKDIRRIREYNCLSHVRMSPREIVEDTRKGAEPVQKMLQEREATKA